MQSSRVFLDLLLGKAHHHHLTLLILLFQIAYVAVDCTVQEKTCGQYDVTG